MVPMAIETNAIVLLEVTNPQCRLAQAFGKFKVRRGNVLFDIDNVSLN